MLKFPISRISMVRMLRQRGTALVANAAAISIALTFAILTTPNSPAVAQGSSAAPAIASGKATCGAKYNGSFWDPLTNSCWTCPSSAPNRTVFSVTSNKACEKPAYRAYKRASGPKKPTGLLRTDCQKGWFLDIGLGSCYSCPSGYKRGTASVKSSKACFKRIPLKWTSATKKGKPGCADGSFRNGLSENCFKCPAGYVRNLNIGSDLTKIDACSRLNSNSTQARYEREKNADPSTQANGQAIGEQFLAVQDSNAGNAGGPGIFDQFRIDTMRASLKTERQNNTGYNTIEWYVSTGGSLLVGYNGGYGYAMTYDGQSYTCRTVKTHTFVGGVTAGAGLSEEWTFSKTGLDGVSGESNGYNVGLALFVGLSQGMEWDAEAPHSRSFSWGISPGTSVDANGEYNHSWTETGADISCDHLSWDGAYWESAHAN